MTSRALSSAVVLLVALLLGLLAAAASPAVPAAQATTGSITQNPPPSVSAPAPPRSPRPKPTIGPLGRFCSGTWVPLFQGSWSKEITLRKFRTCPTPEGEVTCYDEYVLLIIYVWEKQVCSTDPTLTRKIVILKNVQLVSMSTTCPCSDEV